MDELATPSASCSSSPLPYSGDSECCNKDLLQQLPKPLAARVELALESATAVEFAVTAGRLRQDTLGKGWPIPGTLIETALPMIFV